MKIEIEVVERDNGSKDYTVTNNGKFADRLTFDEMLGLIASLTMPESRRCIQWLKTQDEWDQREQRLQGIRERNADKETAFG
ncbi:hypothetical protein Poly51_64040 [Rubripirellula tenax]|uniref:Uncharacterized protein n=1 Tax=Rubripirellula tenax TaxID=2528015 RepID=A0A5C6DRA2_9BACT|nr:hypothetical protein [Rubripirellula tenax]TWU39813.1 hypothetical protein Poly51_64040 [Rubripirellula tenax]